MYPEQKTLPVDLTPQAVECFVFWTRNPRPFFKYLDELDALGYSYYFLYTLIGYPRLFDPGTPDWPEALETFSALSQRLGPERVSWRYDPIILTDQTPLAWHQDRMERIADTLHGKTRRMIFSFVLDYAHARARYAAVKSRGVKFVSGPQLAVQQEQLVEWIGQTLPRYDIKPLACADKRDWSRFGVEKAHCIDGELVNALTGSTRRRLKDKAQRKDCGCAASRDIGANETCLARCFYCYATKDFERAQANYQRHDPDAEFLTERR